MNLKPLIILPMLFTFASCLEGSKTNNNKTASTQRLETDSDAEYAAKLTRVGEILINNPVGFGHANDLFKEALKYDSGNDKALFYSALTEIVMTMEGVGNRAKGLFVDPTDFDRTLDEVNKKYKYPEFTQYLLGDLKKSKINTAQEAKNFVSSEVLDAFESASEKFARIDRDINLILTEYETTNTTIEYNCVDQTDEDGHIVVTCEEVATEMNSLTILPAKTKTVDALDAKIVGNTLKAYATMFKIYTSYSIEGVEKVEAEREALETKLNRSLTDKEMDEITTKYAKYLTLESNNKLGEVVADLESIAEAGLDFEVFGNTMCNNEVRVTNLVQSICFDEETKENLVKTLEYLSGPREVELGKDINGASIMIVMDLPRFLNNPISDIKSLIEKNYDSEGNRLITVEPRLNGLFPNNDWLEKTRQVVHNDEE